MLLFVASCLFSVNAFAEAVEIDGIYYNLITKAKQAEVTSNPNKYTGAIKIPETVSHNGVAYSVASIGGSTFYGCSDLTSVTIPNSVTSIGDYAFLGCDGLTSITIPNSVTNMGNGVFFNCSGLTSVTIGNSVTSIGNDAFLNCRGLTSVTIPNSVKSIGNYAFQACSGLTSVNIGNSVISIGKEAFSRCFSLTSVTIPNSVTSIGEFAFSRCSGLTSVTIANSVKSIGEYAFVNCAELTDVYCYAENVPSTGGYSFLDANTQYATLHVPALSIEKYKTTAPWSHFSKILAIDGTDIAEVQAVPVLIQTQGNTITVQGAEAGTEIILYGVNGVQLDSVIATTGVASLNTSRLSGSVAIVKIGNKTVKVLVKH